MHYIRIYSSHTDIQKDKDNLPNHWIIYDCEHDIHCSENTIINPYGIDGYENGFGYVDLGLPSGTLWASHNFGADNICDTGLFFQWGNPEGKQRQEDFVIETEISLSTIYYRPFYSYDYQDQIRLADDMVNINMGSNWVLPSKDDVKELVNNCIITQCSCVDFHNNNHYIYGTLFTSKINGHKIFIPDIGKRYTIDATYDIGYTYFNVSGFCLWLNLYNSRRDAYSTVGTYHHSYYSAFYMNNYYVNHTNYDYNTEFVGSPMNIRGVFKK